MHVGRWMTTGRAFVDEAHRSQRRVVVRTPAKINLFLAVRGTRADGYHELVSVMQSTSLHDELSAAVSGPPGRDRHPAARRHMRLRLHVDEDAGVPTGEDNLVTRAALVLGRRLGTLDSSHWDKPVTDDSAVTCLSLTKRIPVAGGMAGGSTDAAAALVALNRLWEGRLDAEELRTLAAELGSDVPFCVVGGTALATGRGTRLVRVLCRGVFYWVIGRSGDELSTAAVYRSWDEVCRPSTVEPDAVLAALSAGDAEALGGALSNDLQAAAFALRPGLGRKRSAMLAAGALGSVLSGSGPTLLGLARDAADAQRLAAAVRSQFTDVHVATSPAGGPEVMR